MRTRIVKGNITKIIGKNYKMFAVNDIEFNAGNQIIHNAKDGTFYEQPDKPEVIEGNFIIDGEWLDIDGKAIDLTKNPHKRIGEKVYFRVKTKDIAENTPISFELWEHDGVSILTAIGTILDIRAFDDYVPLQAKDNGSKVITANVDKDGYTILSLDLTEYFEQYIEEDQGTCIELYFIARYWGHEIAYLPRDSEKYLKVGYSDRTLYIQSAAGDNKYGLPEFRTRDSDIIIFSGGVESVDNALGNLPSEDNEDALGRLGEKLKDKIKDKIEDKITDKTQDILQKARTTIAIHQLKLKKLAFTDGIVRQKKKLYDYTLFDNNGEQYIIQKASNFGFKKAKTGEVVTSKGISQLDYFRETNIYSKVAKVGMSALEALSFLDLAKFISGNGEQGQIPSPIPALDFVIGLMLADTKEHIDSMVSEVVDNTLETAKNLGINGVDEFLRVGGSDLNLSTAKIKDVGLKKYETIDVSQETLENLLTGKLRKEKQLRDSTKKTEKLDSDNYRKAGDQVFKSSLKYKILLDIEYDYRISDYNYFVNSIFIK